MSQINYDFKFNAESAPYLDEFTLGFLFACHSDLDSYEDFIDRESTNEDLAYLSVALMRKDCLEIQQKIKPILESANEYGLSDNQIGFDFWQIRNNKPYYYLQSLPDELRDSIVNIFQIYAKPCQMIKNKEGNFIFTYKDPKLQESKENELLTLYSFISKKKIETNINQDTNTQSFKNALEIKNQTDTRKSQSENTNHIPHFSYKNPVKH